METFLLKKGEAGLFLVQKHMKLFPIPLHSLNKQLEELSLLVNGKRREDYFKIRECPS